MVLSNYRLAHTVLPLPHHQGYQLNYVRYYSINLPHFFQNTTRAILYFQPTSQFLHLLDAMIMKKRYNIDIHLPNYLNFSSLLRDHRDRGWRKIWGYLLYLSQIILGAPKRFLGKTFWGLKFWVKKICVRGLGPQNILKHFGPLGFALPHSRLRREFQNILQPWWSNVDQKVAKSIQIDFKTFFNHDKEMLVRIELKDIRLWYPFTWEVCLLVS